MLGPEMKSTGEVMGIDYDFGLAFYKACISADNELPLKGNVFISVNIEQKDEVIPIARKLRELGLTLYGTEGTVDYLYDAGVEAHLVRKVQEGFAKRARHDAPRGDPALSSIPRRTASPGRIITRSCVRQSISGSPISPRSRRRVRQRLRSMPLSAKR